MGCCLCGAFYWALLTGFFLFLGKAIFGKKDPPKIAGVYSQPGKYYWPKVIFFYILMKLRKVRFFDSKIFEGI